MDKRFLIPMLLMLFGCTQFTVIDDCSGGASYLITDANVQYNDDLATEVIKVEGTINGRGECLRVVFDKDDINSEIKDQGYSISQEKLLDVFLTKNKQSFSIQQNQEQIVYEAYIQDIGIAWLSCDVDDCLEEGIINTFDTYTAGLKCHCVYLQKFGISGDFTGTIKDDFEVQFNLEGYSPIKINSEDARSAKISDKIMVNWKGNLLSDSERFTTFPTYDVFYKSGKYTIVREGTYNSIESDRAQLYNCLDSNALIQHPEDCVSEYNNQILTRLSDKKSELLTHHLVESLSLEGNKVIVELAKPPIFPEFDIYINADFVGIKRISGDPKVTCPSSQTVDSSDTKTATCKVENTGNYAGSFDLSLKCGQVSQYLSQNNVNLNSGSSEAITSRLSGIAEDKTITQTCIFKATDVSNPSSSDSCSFSLKIEPIEESCNDGQSSCSVDAKYKLTCSNGNWEKEECKYGCKYSSKGAVCREQECSIDDDCLEGMVCEDNRCVEGPSTCEQECEEKYTALQFGMKQGCKLKCKILDNVSIIIMWSSIVLGLIIISIFVYAKNKQKSIKSSPKKKRKKRKSVVI